MIPKKDSESKGYNTIVKIDGDVIDSTVTVLTRIFQFQPFEKIKEYRSQPYKLLLDVPFILFFLSLSLSIIFLLYNAFFYGSTTSLFSSTWSLYLFPKFENIIIGILCIGSTTFLIINFYFYRWGKDSNKSFTWDSILLVLIVSLIACILFLSSNLKNILIDLNYYNALARVDELVYEGQFELAEEILHRYPEDLRAPPSFTNRKHEKNLQEQANKQDIEDIEESNEVLIAVKDIAYKHYHEGNYQEIVETICGLSHTELKDEVAPYLRSALYYLSHNPSWGPEKTLELLNQVSIEYPECKEISSPFWLAIPPEIVWMIQERNWIYGMGEMGKLYMGYSHLPFDEPIDPTKHEFNIRNECINDYYDSTLKKMGRCEWDMRLVEYYLERFPNDSYADYGKLYLGNLDQIVYEGYEDNENVYDFAYYERGWRQFQLNHYDEALKTFQGFLFIEHHQDHPWRDDAMWRVSECYKRMGKYVDALHYLSLMENESDGEVPDYASVDRNVLYIADVLMSVEDLSSIVTENHFPNLQPILKYTLAERLFVEEAYSESREYFEEISIEYKNDTFESSAGINYSLAELADEKINVINIVVNLISEHPHDSDLYIAEYLEIYDAYSPLENELRYYIPMIGGVERGITRDYLVNRSKNYLSAKLREDYISKNPNDPRIPDLLFKIAQNYEIVASWYHLPEDEEFIDELRGKAATAYLNYIENYPRHNREKFDTAMEHAGSLYLLRCQYSESKNVSNFTCDMDSVIGMRKVYNNLIEKYPKHRLANNMLNWVAWSYCFEANYPGNSLENYISAYKKALEVYTRIIEEYPDGVIGENAEQNISIINYKLANPLDHSSPHPNYGGW